MDKDIILQENSNVKNKSERKYKCPYCDVKDTRYNLVYHVEDKHSDLIPENYTAARVVFNYINNKDSGRCIMCKNKTDWNEDRWKYERLCNSKKCHDEYVKMVKGRMLKKYNKVHLLDDEEFQKKMLDNRSISGKYKFKDGGVRSYVGTYERKALEFCETLNYTSNDIMTPGPTIVYEYKGKKHKWITDIFIIPSNLVIDVKDGGSNPNNRNMKEYRAKQLAKEKAIKEQGEYNYLRLTDNDFTQLMYILAEIKQQLLELPDEKKDKPGNTIVEINESSATAGAIPPLGGEDGVYMIPCMMNNVYSDTMVSTDPYLSDIYRVKDNRLQKVSRDELDGYDYSILKYNKPDFEDVIKRLKYDKDNNTEIYDNDYLYKTITGRDVICKEQIFIDSDFDEILDKVLEAAEKVEIEKISTEKEFNELAGKLSIKIPLFENSKINDARNLLKNTLFLEVNEDLDGYFVENVQTKRRSKSYKSIKDIPDYIPSLLE